MRQLLCYGDSNTWGYDPAASRGSPLSVRYPWELRWTGVLQRELGGGYRVVEEGLNGRTTVFEDPLEEGRNGRLYLGPCLQSHRPLDLVILMLGTNNLKTRFGVPPGDVAEGAAQLVQTIQRSGTGPRGAGPQVLLACPPAVGDLGLLPQLNEKFSGAGEKAVRFPALYEGWAAHLGCRFFDTQSVVKPSPLDGLHLESEGHLKLGQAMAQAVRSIFD